MSPLTPNRRTLLAGTAGGALLGATGVNLVASPAEAAAIPRPRIHSCKEWGAKAPRGSITMRSKPTTIVIHHTTNKGKEVSLSSAYRSARSIQTSHFGRGWVDTGQHFTVSRGGYILEGRHRTLEGLDKRQFPQGAHTTTENATALGIEVDGLFTTSLPPAQQYEQVVRLATYLCRRYGIHPGAIHGHRDFESNICPGGALYKKLPNLRWQVQKRLKAAS